MHAHPRSKFQGSGRAAPAAALVAILVLASLLASCSTTEGSAYASSAGTDSAAAAAAARKAERKPAEPPPPPPPSPAPYPNTTVVIVQPPEPAKGSVFVRGLPSGASLYVDGSLSVGSNLDLAPGEHFLRAEAFGHEDWEASVYVFSNSAIELDAYLPEAAFLLGEAEALPARFDPREPGGFGRVALSFAATARGEASLVVLDGGGAEIARLPPLAIDERYPRLVWNGRDAAGRPVPAGSYLLRVEGRGVDGAEATSEAQVLVAPSVEVGRFSSLHGGFSGALFAPDARLLADGRFQAAAGAYAVFEPLGARLASRMPAFLGFRAGGLFRDSAELVLSGMVVPYVGYGASPSASWASASASLKFALLRGETAAAFLATAGYASFVEPEIAGYPPGWDGPGRFPGLGAGLVLERRFGAARAFGSAELRASRYYPGWGDLRWETPGLFAWAYLRGGLERLFSGALGGDLAVAISAAARSEPSGSVLAFGVPLSLGLELHWYAPEGGRVISLYGAGEWDYVDSWYLGGGIGFGFAL